MKELGKQAEKLHFSSGKKMADAGINYLFTLGDLSAATSSAFGKNAKHFQLDERQKLIDCLLPLIKNNVTILVKGSRSMKMEKILAHLIPTEQLESTH